MKILFMTPNVEDNVSVCFIYHFEHTVSKYAECKWAGAGYEGFRKDESAGETVERVMPDADWVIFYERQIRYFKEHLEIPKKRDYRTALHTYDIHWLPEHHIKELNEAGWDALLMPKIKSATVVESGTKKIVKVNPDYFLERLKPPIFYNHYSVSPDIFKPSNEPKLYEAVFLGDYTPKYYPLRNEIFRDLHSVCAGRGWRFMARGNPPGHVMKDRTISRLLGEGYIVGPRYAEALARTKTFLFDTSVFKEAVLKFPEGMASRTCVMSDTPLTAEELHYEPGFNFVEVGMGDWADKLAYYLRHDEERGEIARNGYETFLKYHTNDVRARQLVDFLEEHS